MKKYVVAGTWEQYRNHMAEKRYDPKEYVYVSSPDQLLGLAEIDGFYIGTYEQRPDIKEIKQIISMIKASSKIYKSDASQSLPPLPPTHVYPAPSGFTPKHIMIKDGSQWKSYDLTNGSITYGPSNDDSTIPFATR